MDDDRLLAPSCYLHLPREGRLLHIARGMVVVIIQPNLAQQLPLAVATGHRASRTLLRRPVVLHADAHQR